MIDKIIEFSARNRFLIFLLVIMATVAGWFSLKNMPIDALPDLSDTQVIIYTKWDRPPGIIEDQVTYPIISAMLGAPRVTDIRGISTFGTSYVYVTFKDGTDPYWARSRTLEYLSKISAQLPANVHPELGPDATGVGWVYEYALVDKSGKHSLADLRTLQDWDLRYQLESVPGVAEVAAIGGYQLQYQVKLNPNALYSYHIPIEQVVHAIQQNNNEVGARVLEISGAEYMIRGRGYIKNRHDLDNTILAYKNGTPIYIKDVGTVTFGPEMRRGVADYDGEGDAVGGIVIMRYGANAEHVIAAVKKKLNEIKKTLPKGVRIVTTYDRSDLIHRAINTLKHELKLEIFVVCLVIIAFLLHLPSAIVPIVILPLAVLISFVPMYELHVSANIMSLGGIAIAIGAMVDAAIVVVENVYKHIEHFESSDKVIIHAIKEVGPSSFYSLLVIAVSFLPIFALKGQEGRLFKPLAYTKNISMFVAAVLSITLAPALLLALSRIRKLKIFGYPIGEKISQTRPEENHPISRALFRFYGPVVHWAVDHRKQVLFGALTILLLTIPAYLKLGSEFMPPLNEGTILYMPETLPGISIASAQNLLEREDQVLMSFPEVKRVFGKSGHADTATDPAPLSMTETTIMLKPRKEWPPQMTWKKLIAQMDAKMNFAGVTNSWTMPIKNRVDMLTTGIRTPVGIKIFGDNLKQIQKIGVELVPVLQKVRGTRSVFAERSTGGYYLDFDFNRERLARYGLNIAQAQNALMTAVGGKDISQTIQGRERFPINVRYFADYRSNINSLRHVLIATPSGAQIPMGEVANIRMVSGPDMIRDENGRLASYVYIDVTGRDIGRYVAAAKRAISKHLKLPTGMTIEWAGEYQNMSRADKTLKVVLPLTLLVVILLLFANTKSWAKTTIILMAVPFSAVGAVWLLFLLHYNMSVAVWVGLIALLGVDAETGIFMLLYLDLAYNAAYQKANHEGRLLSFEELRDSIYAGAVQRVRPKVMTVACLLMALTPVMLEGTAHAGADVMKRIAAPMLGGIVTSFALELAVYPAIFAIWKWNFVLKRKRKLIDNIDDRFDKQ